MENMNNESMNDMMNNIEESMKKIHSGDVVKGKVISVTEDEVLVNLGYISDGIISKSELSVENISPKELVNPDDEIDVYIVKVNDGEGNVVLSKKKADAIKAWEELAQIKEKDETINVTVKEVVKGGEDFCIYSGNDDMIVPVLSLGGQGVISVVANILPEETHNMVMFYLNGNVNESKKLQLHMNGLINSLFIETNPIPVKTAMNLMDMNVGELRLPLTNMSKDNLNILKSMMKDYGLNIRR